MTPTAKPLIAAKPATVVSSGVSGGTSNTQKTPDPIQTNLPTVAAATAAMAAYAAYELQRKHEEELARQAAEEERREKGRAEARARAEVEWARESAQKATMIRKGEQVDMTQAERLAAYQQTNQYQNYQASLQAWEQQKKNETRIVQADMTQAEKLAAHKETEQYKSYQASLQSYEQQKTIEDFRKGERAPENVTVPQKSWLENAWDNTKNFVQQKIVQPVQQVAKPILDNPTVRKVAVQTVVTAATITGLATTYQWYQNVANQPGLFYNLQQNAKARYVQLGNQYPDLKAEPKKKLENLFSKPYEALSAGLATLDAITDTAAEYADTIWQQNPHVQQVVSQLTNLEADTCSKIANHALSNGCTGAFYLAANLGAKPFDTDLGIAKAFVVDPTAGLVKIAALNIEHFPLPDLMNDIKKDGLSGIKNFLTERWNLTKDTVSTDGQVSSALMLLGLLGVAVVAPPVAGGIVLGMTGKGLIDIGVTIAQASNKLDVIRYVTSRQVRTTVVSSAIILGMLGLGMANKVSEFNTFKEGLSPSAQASLQELSLLKQTRLADLASQMKLPPGAVDFYLDHANIGDARLANIPLADALRVSALAEQSGEGAFLLDYVTEHGSDASAMAILKDTSPDALKLYVDQTTLPDSLLRGVTPQDGLQITNGKVVRINPDITVELAKQLSDATGKNAWGSEISGNIYLSRSSPEAIAATKQLISEGIHSANTANLIRIISRESIRGSGGKFGLGPFIVKDDITGLPIKIADVEKGVYIQDALNKDAKFFDVGEAWNMLDDAGFTADDLWSINQDTLQLVMESKSPIEFVYTDVDAMLKANEGLPDNVVAIRVREMRWIRDHAAEFGYKQNGNSWIWQSNP